MRLWTLHPKYLDAAGLVAAWREALLAQQVLRGRTTGYRSHPQLIRFRREASPRASIAAYLAGIHEESRARAVPAVADHRGAGRAPALPHRERPRARLGARGLT